MFCIGLPGRETAVSLPRERIKMSDADIVSRFERLGFKLAFDQIAFTTESVDDFYHARESLWTGVGTVKIYEEGGLLLIEKAQPRGGQPTRDIAVISLGHARAVMGVLRPDKSAELPRYASRME
jgi:nucleoside diphosphate kinase